MSRFLWGGRGFVSRCVSENRLPPSQTNKETQLGFFKKQGEEKLSSVCRFRPHGPCFGKRVLQSAVLLWLRLYLARLSSPRLVFSGVDC